MRRAWLAALAIAALTLGPMAGPASGQEKHMDINAITLSLRPLAVPKAAALAGIKLLEAPGGVQLVLAATERKAAAQAETSLTVMPVGGAGEGGARPFSAWPQVLPVPPAWDLALDKSGARLALVHDEALGATFTLRLTGFDRSAGRLAEAAALASHTRPRFVGKRDDAAERRITAIADKAQAVLFELGAGGTYERKATLCECIDALVLPYLDRFVLLYKTRAPGLEGDPRPGAGTLHWRPLDARLVPLAEALPLFGAQTVFEFAADTTGVDIAVLATTPEGTRLAVASAPAGPWSVSGLVEAAHGQALSRPALALTAEGVHLALLEHAGSARARVLYGHAPLASLGKRQTAR